MDEAGKLIKKRSKKIGLPPGTLVYIGEERTHKAQITVMEFSSKGFREYTAANPSDCLPLKKNAVTWINVDAIHDSALLAAFGEAFHLQPMLLEDVLNTEQRPKCEKAGDAVYVMLKMLDYDTESQTILTEQISMIIGDHWLLTFQEEVGDEFDMVRQRLRTGGHKLRDSGADYLAYSLLDIIVDRYFMVLEKLSDELEALEDRLEDSAGLSSEILHDIHTIRRELIFLRKSVWPIREVISALQTLDTRLITQATHNSLKDVYDHTIQIIDTLETYRDLLSSIQDLYLSSLSNRMNEIMKVLTMISTVFIPLTFLVGVYGMNFRYMPELNEPWAYPAVWAVMIVMAIGMLIFFRRKGWI